MFNAGRFLPSSGHPAGLWLIAVVLPAALVLGQPVVALLAGAAIGLLLNVPPLTQGGAIGRLALQSAIVLLGFKLDVGGLVAISADYVGWVAVYVIATLGAGLLLGRMLGIERPLAQLIAAGTAICGGTAIATLAPIVGARADQVAVALAIVFLLNAVAMLAFPPIGAWLGMTQLEFGLWSAVAIHDTSSVVGTAAIYGDEASVVATTVKLGRTLWLIPLVLVFALAGKGGDTKVRVPGFIVLFIGAAVINSIIDLPAMAVDGLLTTSRLLLMSALFFIGTEIRRETLRQLQGRVLWQAVGLWTTVVLATLGVIMA
jgi:uncharacterized integral membrane protein (TIGR00698 family)